FAAYVATTFRLISELRSAEHIITVDGVEYDTRASLVLVANCGEVIPPYVQLRSGIYMDDGLLDVIVMRADSFVEGVRSVWERLREGGDDRPGPGRVSYARGKVIRIETRPGQPVQLDGEPHGVTPFTAEIVPGAIRMLIPGDA